MEEMTLRKTSGDEVAETTNALADCAERLLNLLKGIDRDQKQCEWEAWQEAAMRSNRRIR